MIIIKLSPTTNQVYYKLYLMDQFYETAFSAADKFFIVEKFTSLRLHTYQLAQPDSVLQLLAVFKSHIHSSK